MSEHDDRIDCGIRLLDAQAPGWERRIDLGTLDLSSSKHCVVGQVFGVADPNWLYLGYEALRVESPRRYGFSLDWYLGYRTTYGGLTRAWKRKIRARRRAALL